MDVEPDIAGNHHYTVSRRIGIAVAKHRFPYLRIHYLFFNLSQEWRYIKFLVIQL
jgi:hypothetical protein